MVENEMSSHSPQHELTGLKGLREGIQPARLEMSSQFPTISFLLNAGSLAVRAIQARGAFLFHQLF
jgi:hypothetical protein